MHHHTENESSLLSLLSSLISLLFSSCLRLLSLSLSVSVFVRCCGRVVVVFCVLCCGVLCVRCGVWCVVCDTLKNPCVHSTRPSVYVHKTSPCVPAPRANVLQHVRVVPAYTGTCGVDTRGEGRGREGSNKCFLTYLSILTGCWVHLLSPIFW